MSGVQNSFAGSQKMWPAVAALLVFAVPAFAFDAYDNPRPADCATQTCHPEAPPTNTVYVDNSSTASPTGAWNAPFTTIQAGLDRLCTGNGDKTSVCVVGDSTDTRSYNETVSFKCSGTPQNPLLLSPLDGTSVTLNKYDSGTAAISSEGNSNVVIRGMRTYGTYKGIMIRGLKNTEAANGGAANFPVRENIYLIDNNIRQTCSSGIQAVGMDWDYLQGGQRANWDDGQHLRNVTIRNNVIQDANDGCASEKLSVSFGVGNVYAIGNDISGDGADPLAKNGGEGIDFKEGVYGGAILDNIVHDQVKRAYYIDGGENYFAAVDSIIVERNIARNITRSGFGIMSEGGGDVSNIRIQNNLADHIGTQAFVIYKHPDQTPDAEISNVNISNNTAHDADYLDTAHAFSINLPGATGIVQNNLVFASPAGDAFEIADGNTMTVQYNFCDQAAEGCAWVGDPGVGADFRPVPPTSAIVNLGGNNIASPAADFDGKARDAEPDIGAFEW